jgi:hypothetical protein
MCTGFAPVACVSIFQLTELSDCTLTSGTETQRKVFPGQSIFLVHWEHSAGDVAKLWRTVISLLREVRQPPRKERTEWFCSFAVALSKNTRQFIYAGSEGIAPQIPTVDTKCRWVVSLTSELLYPHRVTVGGWMEADPAFILAVT